MLSLPKPLHNLRHYRSSLDTHLVFPAVLLRYFNDLWELDLSELTWTAVGNPAAGPWPAARSGCQMMAVSDTCLMVYGGYVKVRKLSALQLNGVCI
jgi:hypothetical protein